MPSQPPDVPPSTGLIAGKYHLVRLIGRGGMGSVWEARHASLGTRFAIKFIEAEYADSQEARSRFDKEARAAAKIQSKHAIQIYDHGVTDDGKPYIVMELLEGEPLDKRIDRYIAENRAMSLQETAVILQQVCRGLARAHEHGIVHRDLKPENIFLVKTSEDDHEVAKVLDFGIAKMQGASQPGLTSSTKTGAVLGTPFYMSPEQARGLRNVDHRTDCWSLGVIAFKCVTGRLPFDGESVGDLLVKICTAPIPVPSQVVQGLPPSFDAWFMRALEREPERRFSTVAELSEGLASAAGIRPGSAPISSYGKPPLSALSTVASGQQGSGSSPAHLPTPAPAFAASYGNAGGNVGSQPGFGTPPPGAMTAAPFTSSKPVPGVPSGGPWKLVVGAAVTGLLVSMIGVGGYLYVKKKDAEAMNGVGMSPPPPVSSLVTTDKPPEKPADKPADPAPPTTVAAVTAQPQQPAQPAPRAGVKPGVPTKPSTVKPAEKPAEKPPATKPTATAKNPSDPGY